MTRAAASLTFHAHVNPSAPLLRHQNLNGSLWVAVSTVLSVSCQSASTHQNPDHICPTLPSDRAAKRRNVKHGRCGSPPLSSPPLFFFYIQKKGTFHLCRLLRDTCACACVHVTEKEQEGENQVRNMTKAMKGTKQAENQSISQSRRLWAAFWRSACSPASSLMSIKRPQKQNCCPKCEKSCAQIWKKQARCNQIKHKIGLIEHKLSTGAQTEPKHQPGSLWISGPIRMILHNFLMHRKGTTFILECLVFNTERKPWAQPFQVKIILSAKELNLLIKKKSCLLIYQLSTDGGGEKSTETDNTPGGCCHRDKDRCTTSTHRSAMSDRHFSLQSSRLFT